MKRTVIFDLYDTLVKVESMDFSRGLLLMRERYMSSLCTEEEIKEYGSVSLQTYLSRHAENREYPFLTGEVPDFFAHFGVTEALPGEDFEYEFMNRAGTFSLCEGVMETLEELKRRGATLYVLSNSIYSSLSSSRLLEELGIRGFFTRVFSSADAGVCKPSKAFYDYAAEQIRQDIPDFDPEQAFFCGDRYDLDARGGVNAGMRTVWINKKGAENTDALPVREIRSIRELPGIVFPGKTVCVGDSLTEGDWGVIPGLFAPNVHEINYPWYLARFTGAEVENRGRCGWKTSHMLEWYKNGGFSVKGAERIIILLGTNGGHSVTEDTEDNRAYRELIRRMQKEEPGAVICLCTPPNATTVPGKFFFGYAPHVAESVRFVRKLAEEMSLPLIDLAASPRITPETEDELQPNDGLHFGEKGYRVLAEEILRRI